MKSRILLLLTVCLAGHQIAHAQTLDPAMQAGVDAKIRLIATWASDPVIVDAVKARNTAVPAGELALTKDKWRALTVLDPLVRSFTKNPVGQFLKGKKDESVTEAFVSDAAGLKVGFLAKTSNWTHKGSPKHDVPMNGKSWQGPVEIDESSGQRQLQLAVPVLDAGRPIGSLVVGFSVSKLGQ